MDQASSLFSKIPNEMLEQIMSYLSDHELLQHIKKPSYKAGRKMAIKNLLKRQSPVAREFQEEWLRKILAVGNLKFYLEDSVIPVEFLDQMSNYPNIKLSHRIFVQVVKWMRNKKKLDENDLLKLMKLTAVVDEKTARDIFLIIQFLGKQDLIYFKQALTSTTLEQIFKRDPLIYPYITTCFSEQVVFDFFIRNFNESKDSFESNRILKTIINHSPYRSILDWTKIQCLDKDYAKYRRACQLIQSCIHTFLKENQDDFLQLLCRILSSDNYLVKMNGLNILEKLPEMEYPQKILLDILLILKINFLQGAKLTDNSQDDLERGFLKVVMRTEIKVALPLILEWLAHLRFSYNNSWVYESLRLHEAIEKSINACKQLDVKDGIELIKLCLTHKSSRILSNVYSLIKKAPEIVKHPDFDKLLQDFIVISSKLKDCEKDFLVKLVAMASLFTSFNNKKSLAELIVSKLEDINRFLDKKVAMFLFDFIKNILGEEFALTLIGKELKNENSFIYHLDMEQLSFNSQQALSNFFSALLNDLITKALNLNYKVIHILSAITSQIENNNLNASVKSILLAKRSQQLDPVVLRFLAKESEDYLEEDTVSLLIEFVMLYKGDKTLLLDNVDIFKSLAPMASAFDIKSVIVAVLDDINTNININEIKNKSLKAIAAIFNNRPDVLSCLEDSTLAQIIQLKQQEDFTTTELLFLIELKMAIPHLLKIPFYEQYDVLANLIHNYPSYEVNKFSYVFTVICKDYLKLFIDIFSGFYQHQPKLYKIIKPYHLMALQMLSSSLADQKLLELLGFFAAEIHKHDIPEITNRLITMPMTTFKPLLIQAIKERNQVFAKALIQLIYYSFQKKLLLTFEHYPKDILNEAVSLDFSQFFLPIIMELPLIEIPNFLVNAILFSFDNGLSIMTLLIKEYGFKLNQQQLYQFHKQNLIELINLLKSPTQTSTSMSNKRTSALRGKHNAEADSVVWFQVNKSYLITIVQALESISLADLSDFINMCKRAISLDNITLSQFCFYSWSFSALLLPIPNLVRELNELSSYFKEANEAIREIAYTAYGRCIMKQPINFILQSLDFLARSKSAFYRQACSQIIANILVIDAAIIPKEYHESLIAYIIKLLKDNSFYVRKYTATIIPTIIATAISCESKISLLVEIQKVKAYQQADLKESATIAYNKIFDSLPFQLIVSLLTEVIRIGIIHKLDLNIIFSIINQRYFKNQKHNLDKFDLNKMDFLLYILAHSGIDEDLWNSFIEWAPLELLLTSICKAEKSVDNEVKNFFVLFVNQFINFYCNKRLSLILSVVLQLYDLKSSSFCDLILSLIVDEYSNALLGKSGIVLETFKSHFKQKQHMDFEKLKYIDRILLRIYAKYLEKSLPKKMYHYTYGPIDRDGMDFILKAIMLCNKQTILSYIEFLLTKANLSNELEFLIKLIKVSINKLTLDEKIMILTQLFDRLPTNFAINKNSDLSYIIASIILDIDNVEKIEIFIDKITNDNRIHIINALNKEIFLAAASTNIAANRPVMR